MKMRLCGILLCAVMAILPASGRVRQRADATGHASVSKFRADVTVQTDGTLEVREEMNVKTDGTYYKYGFVRTLPIGSEDRWDVKYVGEYKRDNGIRVKILEVTENGQPVNYEQGQGYGYAQVRISGNAPPAAGEHRYVVRYLVYGAMKAGTGTDTLYWNAVGHECAAPVGEAVVAVHLPAGVSALAATAEPRAGGRGVSQPRRADTELGPIEADAETIAYRATNLQPWQSLSVAVTWPAGFVHVPKAQWLMQDRWLLAAPIVLFVFYFIAWVAIGPEPKAGTVVTQYEPPQGLSAGAVRFAVTTGSDGRSFAAVIAALAVRGCVRVEPQEGKYKISRTMSDKDAEAKLAPEEATVLRMLFEDGPEIVLTPAMDQGNTAQNTRYVFAIQQELSKRIGSQYITRHVGVIGAGVVATIVCALTMAALAQGRDTSGAFFFTLWTLGAGLLTGLLFEMALLPACKATMRARGGWSKLLPGAAGVGVFLGGIVFLLVKLAEGTSPALALTIGALLAVNLVWGPQLKRRTKEGRDVLDQIAGFRLFLEKVEKDRMDKLNAAGEMPQSLDEHLPYAIALEVREAWGDHLAGTFMGATVMR